MDERGITFRWKDYRAKGRTRHKTMTLSPDKFIRRFLLHVLPSGFHRIRHYGLLANGCRRAHLAQVRKLLMAVSMQADSNAAVAEAAVKANTPTVICPDCGAAMLLVEVLARQPLIRAPPTRRIAS